MFFLDDMCFGISQGGFDMICSGRDKIETPEQVNKFFPLSLMLLKIYNVYGFHCWT